MSNVQTFINYLNTTPENNKALLDDFKNTDYVTLQDLKTYYSETLIGELKQALETKNITSYNYLNAHGVLFSVNPECTIQDNTNMTLLVSINNLYEGKTTFIAIEIPIIENNVNLTRNLFCLYLTINSPFFISSKNANLKLNLDTILTGEINLKNSDSKTDFFNLEISNFEDNENLNEKTIFIKNVTFSNKNSIKVNKAFNITIENSLLNNTCIDIDDIQSIDIKTSTLSNVNFSSSGDMEKFKDEKLRITSSILKNVKSITGALSITRSTLENVFLFKMVKYITNSTLLFSPFSYIKDMGLIKITQNYTNFSIRLTLPMSLVLRPNNDNDDIPNLLVDITNITEISLLNKIHTPVIGIYLPSGEYTCFVNGSNKRDTLENFYNNVLKSDNVLISKINNLIYKQLEMHREVCETKRLLSN